jgi:hypothetical protein
MAEGNQDAPGQQEQRGLGQRVGDHLHQRRRGRGAAGGAAREREQQNR